MSGDNVIRLNKRRSFAEYPASLPWDVVLSSRWMQWVVPGEERVIVWRDCERCKGTGDVGHSYVQEVIVKDRPDLNFSFMGGMCIFCSQCRGSGQVVDRFYTRGISLTPYIRNSRRTPASP